MGPEERTLLLTEFNSNSLAPSEPCHASQTIHGLLEHWAAATPNAPAVIYEVLFMAAFRSLMSAALRSRFMHCRHVLVRCET